MADEHLAVKTFPVALSSSTWVKSWLKAGFVWKHDKEFESIRKCTKLCFVETRNDMKWIPNHFFAKNGFEEHPCTSMKRPCTCMQHSKPSMHEKNRFSKPFFVIRFRVCLGISKNFWECFEKVWNHNLKPKIISLRWYGFSDPCVIAPDIRGYPDESAIKAMDRDAQVELHRDLEAALPDDPKQLAQLCEACVM